jgi:multiple sugar transport system permease protein
MQTYALRRPTLTRSRIILMVIAFTVTAIYFFPVFWMFSTSIKLPEQVIQTPPVFLPMQPQLDNYYVILGVPSSTIQNHINGVKFLTNSFIIALSTTFLTLLLAIPAAYSIARLKIKGKAIYLLLLLTAQMLPSVLLVIPLFVLFKSLGLINTYQGVIIADTALTLPFAIIILRTSFLQIPAELEDAAMIDGCSRLKLLWRIILPLVRSGMIAVAMFSFLTAWGEFVFALSFLQNSDLHPVSIGIFSFIGMYTTQWGALMAFSVLIALPALLAFILLQRHFVSGMTTGAVK